jgi:hypothetical protein
VQQVIIFEMTVRPGMRGREAFRSSIDRIVAHGAGGAALKVIYLADDLAVLRGLIVRGTDSTTDEGLLRYLTASLDGEADAGWDVQVRIAVRS